MNSFRKKLYLSIVAAFGLAGQSCVDDVLDPNMGIDPNVPKEIADGYSVSFSMSLDAMSPGGPALLDVTTNASLREKENYVDLEKLRILFFTCAGDDPNDNSGKYDYFLFESKSRWVSVLSDIETTQANWQVTAPVFTYGNNDDYDWEAIRWALENYPFKIVILANRPDNVDFGDFDGKFGKEIKFATDRGPNWGPKDTYIYDDVNSIGVNWRDWEGRNKPEFKYYGDEDSFRTKPTINSLHHCQWDPIYTSKNNGKHIYDFLVEQPWADENFDYGTNKLKTDENKKPIPLKDQAGVGSYNMMGALSYWTEKMPQRDKDGNIIYDDDKNIQYIMDPLDDKNEKTANFYVHPDPSKGKGIPMYGCQVFDRLTDWKPGTPYNVSLKLSGQTDQYERKNISLLRSVAKIELKIPKRMFKEDGSAIDIKLENPCLHYSNVMARCEPLDVATPTDQLWKSDDECEWNDIMKVGPLVDEDKWTEEHKGSFSALQEVAQYYFDHKIWWFYGAWKDWWHFNNPSIYVNESNLTGPETPGAHGGGDLVNYKSFTSFPDEAELAAKGYPPYPHIFNPVIQRNGNALITECKIDTPEDNYEGFLHYVIYTGEKGINDASTVNLISREKAELVYFSFSIQGTKYYLPLTDFNKNTLWKDYYTGGTGNALISTDYKKLMPGDPNNYNWVLLRNHVYTITVTSFKDFMDIGAVNSQIVSSERRDAPEYVFD